MRRSSTRAFLCVAILVAGAADACSLFVSTDGLGGGSSDASISGDASGDAPSSSDAKAPNDGGIVVDGGGDGSVFNFCESHPGHSICLDFDESTNIPNSSASSFDPANFFIDTAGLSPPNALAAHYPAGDLYQGFDEALSPTKNAISVSMDFKLTASDLTTGQTVPLNVDMPKPAGVGSHFFYIQTYYGNVNVAEGFGPDDGGATNYVTSVLASPVPADTWMHVDFTVDGTTGKMTSAFNGTPMPDSAAQSGFPTGAATLTIGGFAGSLPVATVVHIDNVVVDY